MTDHPGNAKPLTGKDVEAALKSLAGQTALVTGGAGFIGSHLVDALRGHDAKVRILDNLSTGYEKNIAHHESDADVQWIQGDASDAAAVAKAVDGVDVIFHQAAMASVPRSVREPALCHAWCTTSTVHLLEAAAKAGARRFVLASTSAAYGNSPFVSKRETDAVDPLSPYAAAKLSAEQYCRAMAESFDIEAVILRYFNVFGPRQDPQSEYSAVIPRFVSLILAGERPVIYGDGQQSRDFVYVEDVARANLLAGSLPGLRRAGPFNVARGQRTTLLELLDILRGLLDRSIEPIHEAPRIGDVRDSLADVTCARCELQFEPRVDMAEGLRRSIEYYREMVG
ncbi:MAG: NAD-dependent epimerase/dehydratase family protein [Planctomycetota bacterium]